MIDAHDIDKDIKLNQADLNSEMLKQASLYVHYSRLAAKARGARDKAKLNVEFVEAETDKNVRKRLESAGKVTEKMIAAEISLDSGYKIAKESLIEAEENLQFCENVLLALQMKRDMIVQINKSTMLEDSYTNSLNPKETYLNIIKNKTSADR